MSLTDQVRTALVTVTSGLKRIRQDLGASQDKTRALRQWYTALEGAANAPADVLVIGSDNVEGYGATALSRRWTDVFREEVRRLNQPAGIPGGWNYYGFNAQAPDQTLVSGTYPDSPVTASSGSITNSTAAGLGQRQISLAIGASFTLTFYGTGLDVVYGTSSTGGTMNWAVDGGTNNTLGTSGGSTLGNRLQIRGLVRGTHTVVISASGAAVVVEGVALYNGDETAGVRVWEAGHSGWRAEQMTGSTWVASLQTWNYPSLVLINFGSTDAVQGRPAALVKGDIQTIISNLRNRATLIGKPAPSIVLMPGFEIPGGSGPESPGWVNYVTALDQIADADQGVTLVDHRRLFGPETTGIRGGLVRPDGIHPTDAGYGLIGASMARFASPDSLGKMADLMTLSTPQTVTGKKRFATNALALAIGAVTGKPAAGEVFVYSPDGQALWVMDSSGTARKMSLSSLSDIAATYPSAASITASTQNISNVKNPVNAQDAATKAYVDSYTGGGPVGMIIAYPSGTIPPGFVECDGRALSQATYPALFALLGTYYGQGAGGSASTFGIPDLRSRFIRHRYDAGGVGLGATGGSADHYHQNPNHLHITDQAANTKTGASGNVAFSSPQHTHSMIGGATLSDTQGHLPPFFTLIYIIKTG